MTKTEGRHTVGVTSAIFSHIKIASLLFYVAASIILEIFTSLVYYFFIWYFSQNL